MCSDTRWLTVTELAQYGITPAMAHRYASLLVEHGLAERTYPNNDGPGGNMWLFHPDAVWFLQRRRELGRPRMVPTPAQVELMREVWRYGHPPHRRHTVQAVRKALGVSWIVARRWLREKGLRR